MAREVEALASDARSRREAGVGRSSDLDHSHGVGSSPLDAPLQPLSSSLVARSMPTPRSVFSGSFRERPSLWAEALAWPHVAAGIGDHGPFPPRLIPGRPGRRWGTLALAGVTAWLAHRTSQDVELTRKSVELTRDSVEVAREGIEAAGSG
jgi:hypothetical protein